MPYSTLQPLFFFSSLTTIVVAVTCNYGYNLGTDVLSAADCTHIISHMPFEASAVANNNTASASASTPDHDLHGPTTLHPSHPFLPQAQFLHESCLIRASYHSSVERDAMDRESPEHHHDHAALISFLQHFDYYGPTIAVHEPSIVALWDIVRGSAERVNERCVANRWTGLDWTRLDLPGTEELWLLVQVQASVPRGTWPRRTRDVDTVMLGWNEMVVGLGRVPQRERNKFRETSFHV